MPIASAPNFDLIIVLISHFDLIFSILNAISLKNRPDFAAYTISQCTI